MMGDTRLFASVWYSILSTRIDMIQMALNLLDWNFLQAISTNSALKFDQM